MFNNARTYNQEGSWVYVDADEMEKVFFATLERTTAGTGLPGAMPMMMGGMGGNAPSASGSYESALTPMDEDERPQRARPRSAGRRQFLSDEEDLTPNDDDD